VRFSSTISTLLLMAGAIVMSSVEGNAYIACDTHQLSKKPVVPNAISVDLIIPFGYLCHHFEANKKEVAVQKAAYSSNGTVAGPLVKGICNWRIDFVYYDTKGTEYMRDKGETVKGCNQGASRAIAKSKTLPQFGSSCVELITDGEVRLIQCHAMKD
jgi:hypothetical protein